MNKKSAFSLLELIFAIVIIGVIASVAIPKFMDTKADAEAASVKQDISTIVSSVRSSAMAGKEFTNFSEVLTLNTNTWQDSDSLNMKYEDNGSACVTIAVADSELSVTISEENTGTVCTKIKDSGIVTSSYELN